MASRQGFLAGAYAAARAIGLSDVAARVAASQAALESNYGKSAPGNNYFGVKATASWSGPTTGKISTKEVEGGKLVGRKAAFRAYSTPMDSFRDWARVVATKWPGVLTARTFKEAISQLNAGLPGGYATDPHYESKLSFINQRIDTSIASLPDSMQAPPSKFRDIPSAPVAPTPQSIQTAMRLANIENSQYSAPLGDAITSAPLGNIPSVPSRPVSPTPPAALASLTAPAPSPSIPGLGFVSSAEAAPMSPQDMQSAVNLGALPAAGVISGMTAPVGQPPSFNSAMMTAPATSLPTQTLGMPSVPSVPSMPARPVSQTPPAALAAMNNPAFASTPSALTSPDALGPLASLAPPDAVQPTFTPAIAPEIAPPPAAVPTVPTVPNVISAPAQQAVAAAAQSVPSMARAADVYSGAANMGMANDGSTVSRDALGRISVTNKFGATTTTLPGGFQSVSFTGVPSVPSAPQAPTIAGPLSQTSIPSVPGTGLFGISPAKTETGNIARGLTGAFAGSALGSLAGPIGSLIGAAIGKSIAQGKNPLDAFTRQQTTTPGIGMNSFPSAPTSPGALGGTQTNNTAAGMRSISPGAAAIGRGQGGLY